MLTCLASSSVRTPAARGTTSGTKGVASSITVRRTSVLLRSRTPRIYSSLRFSSAAMVWALIMPRSATTQRWPTPKRARNCSDQDGRPLCCELWPGNAADVTTLLPVDGTEELQLHHLCMAWLGEPLADQAEAGGLVPRCRKDLVEEALLARRRELFAELSVVFMDTTSLSFEGQGGEGRVAPRRPTTTTNDNPKPSRLAVTATQKTTGSISTR